MFTNTQRRLAVGLLSTAITLALTGCNSHDNSGDSQVKRPKNIIVMINDGASYGTWDMAAYWRAGVAANDLPLFQDMNVRLGMTTYPLNTQSNATFDDIETIQYDKALAWDTSLNEEAQSKDGYDAYVRGYQFLRAAYTDSAAAGTAMATGTKTYNNSIGYDNHERPLTNLTQKAKARGWATGVVTSVQISHATPGAFSAHQKSRRDLNAIAADQMTNDYVDLLMGTGHPDYDNEGNNMALLAAADPAACQDYWACNNRYDTIGQQTWASLAAGELMRDGYSQPNRLLTDKEDFQLLADGNLAFDPEQPLIGVPKVRSTLQASRGAEFGKDPNQPSGVAQLDLVPDLATMTRGALHYLSAKQKDGIFLMVEGGATDWAAHDHQQGPHKVGYLIEETHDFYQAVEAVKAWVAEHSSWEDTLLIVTTDHGNALPLDIDSDVSAFSPVKNFGKGNPAIKDVNVRFWSNQHTNELARLWAKGWGADELNSFISGQDEGFASHVGHGNGDYIDNTDLFKLADRLIGPASDSAS